MADHQVPVNLAKLIHIENDCFASVLNNETRAFYLAKDEETASLDTLKKFSLICAISGHFQKLDLSSYDCYFSKQQQVLIPKGVEVLVISWTKDLELTQGQCPKAKKTKSLYEILKMEAKPHDFHMIHAGDKYLSSSKLSQEDFIELLKKDVFLVNPSLPSWDEECQEMAEELFAKMDTNHDIVLDTQDLVAYVASSDIMSRFISGKAKDFDDITFDMKIRLAGEMDFTLPEQEVEAMIVALTKRDLQLWHDSNELIKNKLIKDEL